MRLKASKFAFTFMWCETVWCGEDLPVTKEKSSRLVLRATMKVMTRVTSHWSASAASSNITGTRSLYGAVFATVGLAGIAQVPVSVARDWMRVSSARSDVKY